MRPNYPATKLALSHECKDNLAEEDSDSDSDDDGEVVFQKGRRLYIKDLAYAATEEDLEEFFTGYSMYVKQVGFLFARGY